MFANAIRKSVQAVARRNIVPRARCLSSTTGRTSTWAKTSVAAFGATVTAAAIMTSTTERDTNCLASSASKSKIPHAGVPGTATERTFMAVKPDGVQRGLVGKIMMRFEERGYQLVGLKMVWPTKEMAEEHYSDLSSKPFFPKLVKFFSSGPIVCMCWQGKDVIKQGRAMLGETNPLASKPGSIRGDFSIDLGRNIMHGSDGPESAKAELEMWFKPEELHPWKKAVDVWLYE